jgi:predicted anti-sigma-YlaC factor YlaD
MQRNPAEPRPNRLAAAQLLLTASLWGAGISVGCSRLVANMAADALKPSGTVYAGDNDPELVRDALPFGLKTMESLLANNPGDGALLSALASGFTQYAYAFVQTEADEIAATDLGRAQELRSRARNLYERARAYGLRGLEARHAGFGEQLSQSPANAVTRLQLGDLGLIYWTGLAWAGKINVSLDNMALVGELPVVEALMSRALELNEAYDQGAIHDFFVTYDGGRSEAMGGSIERARQHLERSLALSKGHRLAPLVSWAESVCVKQQDHACFKKNLDAVLAFDVDQAPPNRLVNILSQRHARFLLSRTADLFVEDAP